MFTNWSVPAQESHPQNQRSLEGALVKAVDGLQPQRTDTESQCHCRRISGQRSWGLGMASASAVFSFPPKHTPSALLSLKYWHVFIKSFHSVKRQSGLHESPLWARPCIPSLCHLSLSSSGSAIAWTGCSLLFSSMNAIQHERGRDLQKTQSELSQN